jgi:hypothetical protein
MGDAPPNRKRSGGAYLRLDHYFHLRPPQDVHIHQDSLQHRAESTDFK